MDDMPLTDATSRVIARMPKELARMYLQAMKADFASRERAMRDIQSQANLYRKLAVTHDLKVADKFLDEFLQYTSASSLDALVRQKEKKYERELKEFTKKRDELADRYRELSRADKDEQRLLSGAGSMAEETWLQQAYGVKSIGAKAYPTSFSDDTSPAAYRGLLLATGADEDFFLRVVDDLDVDVDDLYETFYNNPGDFDRALESIVAEAQPTYARQLVDARVTNNKSGLVDDIVASEFGTALRSYIKTQLIANMADAELQEMSETIDQLESGGKIADFAFTLVMQDGWKRTVDSFAQAKGQSFEKAEAELRSMINSEGLVDPDTAAKAVALSGDNPDQMMGALEAQSPEEREQAFQQMINRALQNQVDPQATAIAAYFKQLETLPQDPAFALWRRRNGVDSSGPVSLAEAQRYRRQAARAGSPFYRHKRTGDVRLVEAIDTDYAVDTGVGTLFFADGEGNYLTPEQVEQAAGDDLKQARYVEFDLSNDDLRARVFASVADPAMRKALAVVEKEKGFTDRSRMIYDKEQGRFVILDGEKRARFQGSIDQEQQGSVLLAASDPQLADPVGSAAGYQANKPRNYLQDDEFDAMYTAGAGEQVDAASAYLPAKMAEPPKTTFYGEMVYTPGQDPNEFQFMVVGPDGRKQLRKVKAFDPVTGQRQLFEARQLEEGDLEAYNRRTGSDLNERQFRRMLRGPLLGRGRRGRDERQARRARVQSGDSLSTARELEPFEFDDLPEAEDSADVGMEQPETTVPDKSSQTKSRRIMPNSGTYSRALRQDSADRSGATGLPADEAAAGELYAQKIQAADAIARGAAPGTMSGDPVAVGDTPQVVPPYLPGEHPEAPEKASTQPVPPPAPVSAEHSTPVVKEPAKSPQATTPLGYFGRKAVESVPAIALKSDGTPLLQTPSGRSVLAAGDEAAAGLVGVTTYPLRKAYDVTGGGIKRALNFFSGLEVESIDEEGETDEERKKREAQQKTR